MNGLVISAGEHEELTDAFVGLLESAELPTADLAELGDALVLGAWAADELVGGAIVEVHGDLGLLRSVVVEPSCRNSGVGGLVVDSAITRARARGIRRLYLLTETAPDFFSGRGFTPIERSAAPAPIQATTEFSRVCPDTAVAMVRNLGGHIETRLSHAVATDPITGAVVPVISPSTTFARGEDHELTGPWIYSRYSNPTVDTAETALADLDGGESALVFGSGMAAFSAVLDTVTPGGGVLAPQVMYHGALDRLRALDERGAIRLTLFDQADAAALRAGAEAAPVELIWTETPTNPSWDVIDLAEAAAVAHDSGAVLAVDSTVAPPVTTRPLELGADIVFHSATKYLNGHSDLTAGVLVTREADGRWDRIQETRKQMGGVLGAFEAWLLVRGLRTLHVRFRQQAESAEAIARHCAQHPDVDAVLYPLLENHPSYGVASSQLRGGFAMLSLLVRGDESTARRVATGTSVFIPATSLGGIESLIEHRASVEGPHSVVAPNLLRLSIGLEHPDDLIADLDRALTHATS
jgi:cystathionine gamma-synthase